MCVRARADAHVCVVWLFLTSGDCCCYITNAAVSVSWVFREQTSPTAECSFHFECLSDLFEFPGVLGIPDIRCTWNLVTF